MSSMAVQPPRLDHISPQYPGPKPRDFTGISGSSASTPVLPDNPSRIKGQHELLLLHPTQLQLPPCLFLQPPAHSFCTCFLFHSWDELISALHSLAIINHMLSVPPHLHHTLTFPASQFWHHWATCQSTVPCWQTHLMLLLCL